MTPTQRRLARHALGLPNKSRCSNHNRSFAANHSPESEDWAAMAESGLARFVSNSLTAVFYRLTRTGAELALEPGERLDEEDF